MKTVCCLAAMLMALGACGGDDDAMAGVPGSGGTPGSGTAICVAGLATTDGAAATTATYTPVTMHVPGKPIPVLGSDGRYHVVYELELVNATGGRVTLDQLSVFDARDHRVVATLSAAELAQHLVVRDPAVVPGSMGASQAGIVYLHVVFDSQAAVPPALDHALTVQSQPAPQSGGCVALAAPTELVFDPPLRGPRYIAGDGCCDAIRHTRASLPVNGRFFTAQRFAIDWEQLDEQGRIYVGDPKDPASYIIYGKPAYAVADGRVVAALDGLPDTPTGSFPVGIPLSEADGNHVVLALANGSYALYAHFKPGSVKVRTGDSVNRGQVLGLVGTSGNSSEPHLHFHVTDGPSPLASNGVPHRLTSFSSSRRGVSTAAFDQAIIDGQPIATEPVAGDIRRTGVLPLDLWIVDFPE